MRSSIVSTDPVTLMSESPVRSARRASFSPALGTPSVSIRSAPVQPASSQATAGAASSRRDRVRVASRKVLDKDDVAGTSPIPRRDQALVFPPSPSAAAALSSGSTGVGAAIPSPGRRYAAPADIEMAVGKPGQEDEKATGSGSGGKSQYADADAPADSSSESTTGAAGYAARQQRLVRLGFIRKVYAVLTAQLLLTFTVVCLVTFIDALKVRAQTNTTLLWIALGTTLTCMILLACCPGVAHSVPQNYICLLLYTASMSWLLSAAAAFVDSMAVAWAIGGTIIVVLALTLLAWQTRIQFSACSGVLLVLLVALTVFGLSVAAMPSRTMQLVYGTVGVVVFGIFLLVDTSLIVSGSRGTDEDGYGMALETDDYILAALLLYSDVINLFLYMLKIFAMRE